MMGDRRRVLTQGPTATVLWRLRRWGAGGGGGGGGDDKCII